mmetsp:Transcript_31602/g.70867  ORF Transcript_31602/g.70867 Transcript_31602/m.70867 type:complete len:633 (-) Transcript_31602:112-2010(-)
MANEDGPSWLDKELQNEHGPGGKGDFKITLRNCTKTWSIGKADGTLESGTLATVPPDVKQEYEEVLDLKKGKTGLVGKISLPLEKADGKQDSSVVFTFKDGSNTTVSIGSNTVGIQSDIPQGVLASLSVAGSTCILNAACIDGNPAVIVVQLKELGKPPQIVELRNAMQLCTTETKLLPIEVVALSPLPIEEFVLQGTLPRGLKFSKDTGTISGIPTMPQQPSPLKIIARTVAGASVPFEFVFPPIVPSPQSIRKVTYDGLELMEKMALAAPRQGKNTRTKIQRGLHSTLGNRVEWLEGCSAAHRGEVIGALLRSFQQSIRHRRQFSSTMAKQLSAAVIIVPEDVPSIQQAIDATPSSGGVVVVLAGVYYGSLVVDKPVAIEGVGHDVDIVADDDKPAICFQGGGEHGSVRHVSLRQPSRENLSVCLKVTAGSPLVEGVKMWAFSGICAQISGAHTEPVLVSNLIEGGLRLTNTSVQFASGAGGRFERNTISHCAQGISVQPGCRPVVRDNEVAQGSALELLARRQELSAQVMSIDSAESTPRVAVLNTRRLTQQHTQNQKPSRLQLEAQRTLSPRLQRLVEVRRIQRKAAATLVMGPRFADRHSTTSKSILTKTGSSWLPRPSSLPSLGQP